MEYQRDEAMAPDSEFEPGRLDHLVVGNAGRLLDARRTPLRITGVRCDIALFRVEVGAFEDAGATWDLAFEDVGQLQFARGSATAPTAAVAACAAAIERVAGTLDVVADDRRRRATSERLAGERVAAERWLAGRPFALDRAAESGDPTLVALLVAYLAERDLADVEDLVATTYVSNPGSGDVVRAHAVAAAELGLAEYHGRVLRDPDAESGRLSRDRRQAHLLARLGFVATVFRLAGHDEVVLHRGMSFEHAVVVPRPTGTFVSATFRRPIAESLAALGPTRRAGVLSSQRVPVDRLFMTYHETGAMNRHFREAEAVLLADPTALF